MTELGVVSHNRALPLRDSRRPAHSLCSGTDSGRSAKGVNPILGSHWNGGFGSHSGPSRGDPRRRASRPIEASRVRVCYVRLTSKPVKLIDMDPRRS